MAGKYTGLLEVIKNLLESDPLSPGFTVVKRSKVQWGSNAVFPAAFVYFDRTRFEDISSRSRTDKNTVKVLVMARHTGGFELADETLEKLLENDEDGVRKGLEPMFEKYRLIQVGSQTYNLTITDYVWDQAQDNQKGFISICEISLDVKNRSR